MFKRTHNWQLSFVIAIVSICGLVLIQQYVIAQSGWQDPDSLPGETPSNVFVVNPLAEDLQLNNHKLLGSNLIIDGSATNPNAVTLTGGRKICLAGTCRDTWPVVTGGITGAGTAETIPKFTGASTIGDSTFKHVGGNRYKVDAQSGGLWITSNNTSYNPLQINLTDFFQASYSGLDITNTGNGGSIKITDSDGSQVSTDTSRSSFYIVNNGSGKALRIDSSGSGSISPLVVDTLGRMGIGTSTPNKHLHIYTGGISNAEIDIQSTAVPGSHWGIYQNKIDGALRFWNGDNRVTFASSGNVGIGTTTPQDALAVIGTGTFSNLLTDGSLSAGTVITSKGYMTELTVSALTATDGLSINTPSITMDSTSGDSCTIQLISDRVLTNNSGAGHFNITCYAPLNVCGNNIVEPANGEECDPVGRVRYDYDPVQAGLYDCSAKTNFERAQITCQASCQENPTVPQDAVCQCKFRCIAPEPPHEQYYVIDYCSTPGPTACANWGP